VAARFHAGLAGAIEDMIEHLSRRHGDTWGGRIALSGGVFQNAVLNDRVVARLEARDLKVLRHRHVPANDGGLSLGQAVVAAARSFHDHSLSPRGRGAPCVRLT
jgi:hydrogenase maturation protein HypF